ncbi:MAG: MFS transporter [Candidatus Nezhaarchaeales archaeon]
MILEEKSSLKRQLTSLKREVLLAVSISSFLVTSSMSSVGIAIPAIMRDLAMDASTSGWILTTFLLATTVFLVPLGRIADIKGRKKLFVLGNIVFAVSSMLCGFSSSSSMIIGMRVLQGIGGAMIFATGIALISSVFHPKERGRALGLYTSSAYMGLTIGPLLGGVLTEGFSWRSVFFFNAPIGGLVIILTLLKLREEWIEAKGEKLDFIGSVVYGAMVTSVIIGLSQGYLVLIALGAILLGVFILWELKRRWPVLELRLFKNVTFAFSNFAALLNYSATYASPFILSLYLQHLRGLSPQQAGLVLTAQPAIQAIFSPSAGYLADKVEPRMVASIGMGLTALGLWSLSHIELETDITTIIFSLTLIGIGLALFVSPNTKVIMSSTPSKFYGVASAMTATMRNLGQAISMSIITLLMTLFLGKGTITEPSTYNLFVNCSQLAFQVFSALCVVGMLLSITRGKS